MNKILIIALITLLIGCNNTTKIETQTKIPVVKTISVIYENIDKIIPYSGIVKNKSMEIVNFDSISTITKIHVDKQDTITKGDLLVSLDDDNAKSNIEVAKTNKNNAYSALQTAQLNHQLAQTKYDEKLEELNNESEYIIINNRYQQAKIDLKEKETIYNQALNNIQPQQALLQQYKQELVDLTTISDQKQQQLNQATTNLGLDPTNPTLIALVNQLQIEYNDALLNTNNATTKVNDQQLLIDNLILSEDLINKENQYNAAQIEYQQAKTAYDTKEIQRERQLAILNNELQTTLITYNNAKDVYNASENTYNDAIEASNKLNYYAQNDGIVLDILLQQGQVTTPLSPIMIVGSYDKIVEFGISIEDIKLINSKDQVIITKNKQDYQGEVINIDLLPDKNSRTYLTDVLIKENSQSFMIGELVKLNIYTGEDKGIYLPINAILNDGLDYIYIVEDNRAKRKNITLGNINNNMVEVHGLNLNDQVIIKGMKNITSGLQVKVDND